MAVVDLPDEAATAALAERISALAATGDIIALKGDLGAGKTTFARGFIRACGGTEEVPSPTFTLVQEYATQRGVLAHVDLYRVLGDNLPQELARLGLRERRGEGAMLLVEWGDAAVDALGGPPVRHVSLAIAGESARVATLTGFPAGGIV